MRSARHLWRMCVAMFIATGSFFLGQAKVFPEEYRIVPLLAVPMIVVLVVMIYWWARVLRGRRVPRRMELETTPYMGSPTESGAAWGASKP